MISSDFRTEARRKLDGKWGTAVCIVLAFCLISFATGFIQGLFEGNSFISMVISITAIVIEMPLQFGLIYAFFKLFYGENVKAFDFLKLGFDNFAKSWQISFRILGRVIVPFILMIVAYFIMAYGIVISAAYTVASVFGGSAYSTGFGSLLIILGFILLIASGIWLAVKSYYYQLSYIVACDNPDMLPKDCVLKSQELMTNRRGKLFCLQLSFVGWAILSVLTLGIGYLWLLPYIRVSTIAFYDAFAHKNSVEAEVVDDKSEGSNDEFGSIQ